MPGGPALVSQEEQTPVTLDWGALNQVDMHEH